MNDFTRVNAPRVEKMVAMMETILKSARSNRVGERELQQLLEPLRAAQRDMSDLSAPMLPPGVVSAPPEPVTHRPIERRDIILWEEAKTAPLRELMMAYGTINARLLDMVMEND